MVIRGNDKIYPKYLYFFLTSNTTTEWLQHLAESRSGTFPQITFDQVANLDINLPPKPVQERISDFISALDEKIELNRQTNSTLEAIAQAILKEWFVDFNFPGATGDMEKGELGMVPKGWRLGTVSDVLKLSNETITPGKNPDIEFFHFSIPAFDSGRIPIVESGASILSNKFRVRNNSILVSKLNPRIPRVWAIWKVDEQRSICSTEFQVLMPIKSFFYAFAVNLFSRQSVIETMKSRASGTSGSHQRIKPQDILDIEIVVPDDETLHLYKKVVGNYFQHILKAIEESALLAQIRDNLLPKLMKGEIEV